MTEIYMMSKRGIAALREALTGPLGAHLDGETLAVIVTAEAAGEDVEKAYAQALTHIERCEMCAEAYGELAEMMVAAIADMDAAAEAIPPEVIPTSNIWGRAVTVKTSISERWHRLQLELAPVPAMGLLREAASGPYDPEWLLFRRSVGSPLPLIVEARAERQTAQTCRLILQVDRPGQVDASARAVQIRYLDRQSKAVTNSNGVVSFDSLPISRVADLTIEIAAD